MQSRIVGTTMPVLELLLEPGESVISEAGELSWMGQSIAMTTHTQFGGGGGFLGAIKRMAGGGSLFMTEYQAQGYAGEVAFATKIPGHILPLEIGPGHEYLVHRHGFLCATPQIQLGVGFQQSLGAGIFGGDGFLLQKLTGHGTAWLELSGEVVVRDLRPGETLRSIGVQNLLPVVQRLAVLFQRLLGCVLVLIAARGVGWDLFQTEWLVGIDAVGGEIFQRARSLSPK